MAKITLKGNPINTSGNLPLKGSKAPEFTLVKSDLAKLSLSGFRDSDFGTSYGIDIIDGPLAGVYGRSIVVIDETGKVAYTELVPEITQEPDYARALAAL